MNKFRSLSIIIALVVALAASGSGGALAYDFGEFDLGGQTVNLVHYSAGFVEDLQETGRWEDAEEKFNIKLRFAETRDSGTLGEDVMTRLMAGEATHDIWFMNFVAMWPLAVEGILYPINDFMDATYFDDYLPHLGGFLAKGLELNGKIFGFGSGFYEAPAIGSIRFDVYNPEIFEREGLPDLQELYDAGEWTWDRKREIAIQATRDTTGDGEIDQLGIADSAGGRRVDYLATTNGGQFARWIDGRAVVTIDEDPVLEAIEHMRDLQERGVISLGRNRSAFIEGQAAMFNACGGWYLATLNEAMETDYRIVPQPIGPSAEIETHSVITYTNVLPVSSEDPEAMLAIYHYLYPAENMERAARDFYMENVRDRRSYEILEDIYFHGNLAFVGGEDRDLYHLTRPSFGEALTGEKTPAVLMEEQKPEIQARLDDLFGQN